MIATIGNFLTSFEISDMAILKSMGYEVHCAANFVGLSETRKKKLEQMCTINHQIDFGRSPFSRDNLVAYHQLRKLFERYSFDIVHCHTPIGAAVGRIAAKKHRKKGTRVIYTCHGYHFHKKSNKKQWLLYFPMEKMLAHYTDMIIAINKEDYELSKHFKVPYVKYIPGVGIDAKTIENIECSRKKMREEYKIPDQAFVILTIGELSDRKNQEVIIRAMADMKDDNVYYLLCGNGHNMEKYKAIAKELDVYDRVIFAGYVDHEKVLQLCHAIDIGAIPSKIEGLGLAGLEILASGHPLVGSNVHGIRDYLIDGKTGISVDPDDYIGFAHAIKKMKEDKNFYRSLVENTKKIAEQFDIEITKELMSEYYAIFDKN